MQPTTTSHEQQMIQAHPRGAAFDEAALHACLHACLECVATCTTCADACSAEQDREHGDGRLTRWRPRASATVSARRT